MSISKKEQLEYLKKEEIRLEEVIERFLSYDLEEMAVNSSKILEAVKAKIKELEED